MAYTLVTGDAVNFALATYTPPNGNAVDFELNEQDLPPFLIGFYVTGNIGKEGAPDLLGVNGIYQMRMTKRGKRHIKMKFYRPTNPRTVPQQANRTKFATAVSLWGALTTEQKSAYNIRAKRRNMFGWGLFIREYYQSNP